MKARCDGGIGDPGKGAPEFTVFEIQATVQVVKREDDRGLHIVLEDKGWTMVAELLGPKCPQTRDGKFVDYLKAVHTTFAQRLADGELDGRRIRVRGVGFYDASMGRPGWPNRA